MHRSGAWESTFPTFEVKGLLLRRGGGALAWGFGHLPWRSQPEGSYQGRLLPLSFQRQIRRLHHLHLQSLLIHLLAVGVCACNKLVVLNSS